MAREFAELEEVFGLAGRVALVTGSTRGIGRAIAQTMARAGADVIVHGRQLDDAERVAAEIGARGAVAADLGVPAEVDRMCAALLARGGPLDALVLNAGIERGARVEHVTAETLDETLQVNLKAPVALVRALLPALRASSSASVTTVSSIHESVPSWGNGAYAASKAALAMITKTLAIELGPERIRVNSVAPGAIATDINRDVLDEIGEDLFAEWIPLGRVGSVTEVAPAVVFLSSRAASYITGATLVVDGGYSHHLVRYRHSAHDGDTSQGRQQNEDPIG